MTGGLLARESDGRPPWAIFVAFVVLSSGACQRGTRCATCGMRIDSASAWVSYITVDDREVAFDTPRCAVTAWRAAQGRAKDVRFREYYSRALKNSDELRFVAGSDVVGPMGPDLVPIATDKAERFARDHNGAPPRTAAELLGEEPP